MNNKLGDITSIKTGFNDLDAITCGLQRKDLIVIASRPGVGKTTFAINLACNFCNNGYNVAYFILELSSEKFVKKALCRMSKAPIENVAAGKIDNEQIANNANSTNQLLDKQLFVCDKADLTIVDFENKCKELKKNNGLDVAIIDYLQLLTVGKGNDIDTTRISSRKDEIDYLLRKLKVIARELDIVIIVTSQLCRSAESNGDPQMSDFREPSGVEHYADVVFLMRIKSDVSDDAKTIDIVVSKNNNGETGTVSLSLDKLTLHHI